MGWLGLDIGGANLKIADGNGYADSMAFPLWRHPEKLASALQKLLAQSPRADSLAATMTGELADCFATKAEGVGAILDAVEQAASGRTVRIYHCDGQLVNTDTARAEALLAAASNWHALADFARRYCSEFPALLIDVGSTTCDLIPIGEDGPRASGKTDPERLLQGELVYTGVERSPLCAIVSHVPWQNQHCPVAQEFFATTADVYLMTGDLPEDPQNVDTADGRPRTQHCAHARLARTICADTTMVTREDAHQIAEAIYHAQLRLLLSAAEQVTQQMPLMPKTILFSGHGEFLSRELANRLQLSARIVSLTEHLGSEVSRAACAHSLAVLARERSEA